MKKFAFLSFASALLLFATLLYSCGKDGTSIFIPILEQRWVNKDNSNNEFFFFNYQNNASTSTFDGNENNPNGDQDNFSGSFNNHNITFTYTATTKTVSKRGKTYSGTINDASTVMMLSSSTLGNLVLEKK